MSIERAFAISITALASFLQSDHVASSDFRRELAMGPESFKHVLAYVYGLEEDSEEQCKHTGTVFQAKMPGAMTVEEVEDQIDLSRWNLKIGNKLVNLKVSPIEASVS